MELSSLYSKKWDEKLECEIWDDEPDKERFDALNFVMPNAFPVKM
jgi:hypothetical protein